MAQIVLETIIIDQEGDAIITLTKPGTPFAIWEPILEDGDGDHAVDRVAEARDEENGLADLMLEDPTSATENLREVAIGNWGGATADDARSIEPLAEMEELREEEGDRAQSDPELTAYPEPAEFPEPAVEYRVSSKHLALASGKFRSELTGSWGESTKGDDGLHHLTAEDWDPEVFTILLNIMHLRNRQVPPSITLETLAKLAVLIDYYRCWEAVEMWTNTWITEVKKEDPVPELHSRNLMLWMLIAWVFDLAEEFEITTATAIRQSKTPSVYQMDLPIPPLVVSAMEFRRYDAIDAIISTCHHWIEKFRDTYVCPTGSNWSFSCASILLGALTKELHRLGYLSPKPGIPFAGHSVENIHRAIKDLKSPQWCKDLRSKFWHGCSLQGTLGPDVDEILISTQGLRLHDFKDHAKEQ